MWRQCSVGDGTTIARSITESGTSRGQKLGHKFSSLFFFWIVITLFSYLSLPGSSFSFIITFAVWITLKYLCLTQTSKYNILYDLSLMTTLSNKCIFKMSDWIEERKGSLDLPVGVYFVQCTIIGNKCTGQFSMLMNVIGLLWESKCENC